MNIEDVSNDNVEGVSKVNNEGITNVNIDDISNIRCFLLDMDGTFYLGDRLIDGSLEFIDAVRRAGKSFLFLTNNSSRSAAHYVEKLARLGLDVDASYVLTSGQATGEYIMREFPQKMFYLLGNESLHGELSQYGVRLGGDFCCGLLDDLPQDTSGMGLCVGFDTTLTYEKLCVACDLLRNGAYYIATHPDFNCPTETGFVPDIGAIIAFLHASTGRKPDIVIGKPNFEIVRAAMDRTGCAREDMCIVGDRLYTDIRTGIEHGLRSALVLTGEATVADLRAFEHKPDFVFDRLQDFIPYLL